MSRAKKVWQKHPGVTTFRYNSLDSFGGLNTSPNVSKSEVRVTDISSSDDMTDALHNVTILR